MSRTTKKIVLYTVFFVTLGFAGITMQSKALSEYLYSPGHLVQAHSETVIGCQECHVPWQPISQVNCTTSNCHSSEKMATQIESASLLEYHKQNESQDCMSCHTEHLGEGAKITFNFDHETLSSQQSCLECHKGDVPQDHQDNSFGDDCASCHSTTAWEPATFDHNKYFPLNRDHDVSCSECHTDGNFKEYTCTNCHSESEMLREHHTSNYSKIADCMECHQDGRKGRKGHFERQREEGYFRERDDDD